MRPTHLDPNQKPEDHWGTLRQLLPYLWPPGRGDLKTRVMMALGLLVVAKLTNVYVPILLKTAVDTLGAGQSVLLVAPIEELDRQVAMAREIMTEAGKIVLDGFVLGTDAELTHDLEADLLDLDGAVLRLQVVQRVRAPLPLEPRGARGVSLRCRRDHREPVDV